MALETLKGIEKIGNFDVVVMDTLKEKHPHMFREDGSMKYEIFEKEIRPNFFIYLRNDVNSISFNIQNGPVKENGVNGCQVDTLIHTAKMIISKLNENFPCSYNHKAVGYLEMALAALEERKENRVQRGVEGKNLK